MDNPPLLSALAAELGTYREIRAVVPAPVRLYRATDFIAFVCSRFPDLIPLSFRRDLVRECVAARASDTWTTREWYRAAGLEAAAWALGGEPWLLDSLIANIDHSTSELRLSVLEALALIANRLPFDTPGLISRVESVVSNNYMYADVAIAILLSTTSNGSDKLDWVMSARTRFTNTNSAHEIETLACGEPIPNPIAERISAVERLVLARLVSELEGRDPTTGWQHYLQRLSSPSSTRQSLQIE